jgi:hypothetical protein
MGQLIDDKCGEAHLPVTGSALRWAAQLLTTRQLDHLAIDDYQPVQQIDISASQADELTKTERSVCGEEDHGSPAGIDDAGDGGDVAWAEDGSLVSSFCAGAFDTDRVGGDQTVLNGRGEDGVQ